MFASSWFDPVLGVDIHWELIPVPPAPVPVPTPIPNPFTGIVLDLGGLVGGLVMSAAKSLIFGAPFTGPVVYWGVIPATNTGTNAKHIPGHILIPPGVGWAPVPRTPKPKVRPKDKVVPAPPIKPDNDAVCITGSKTVHVGGSNAVRLLDLAMSCSEPVRLPSSLVLAVPKGPLILIGGPPTLDIAAAIMASLRTRFISDSLHALVSRLPFARLRRVVSAIVCFFTGHPVDVASGAVMTSAVDAELPGPLPLRIQRVYSSAFGDRDGPLGHGWSLSLDQAIWTERGKVVLLEDDGREIEFDTFDLPGHRMSPGDELWQPIDQLTLRCLEAGRWRVTAADGVTRDFAPVPGRHDGRAMVERIRSRGGQHEIAFEYDKAGRLEWVRDSCGRLVWLAHDPSGRVSALKLPLPTGQGWYAHRRYSYDAKGDLAQVTDSLGKPWRFEYFTHLLVKETDRTGLSFYFEYDGTGQDAWCTRTWGDGGIYDHRIAYDKVKKITLVTNSLGQMTQYHMNLIGQVVKVVDPLGAETKYRYDERTLQRVREEDALGGFVERELDSRGKVVRAKGLDGAVMQLHYDAEGLPARAVDSLGRSWSWSHDREGNLTERISPTGERTAFGWRDGLLSWIELPGGRRTALAYDEQKNLAAVRTPNGADVEYSHDALGRRVRSRDARGGVVRIRHDSEGRVLREESAIKTVMELSYDAEGNPVEVRDANRRMSLRYGHFHKIVAREEAGTEIRLSYDTEGRLTGVVNQADRTYTFARDEAGRVSEEIGFDGSRKSFSRDKLGRVAKRTLPSGRTTEYAYDAAGRIVSQKHSDGTGSKFDYRPGGGLVRAENEYGTVRRDLDASGRVLQEEQGEFVISSKMNPAGEREAVETSLGARTSVIRDVLGAVESLYFGQATSRAGLPGLHFERDPAGLETGRQWDSGISVRWQRDALGRALARDTERRRDGTTRMRLDARAYEWRGEDQIAAIVEAGRETTRFQHDQLGRLIAQSGPRGIQHRAVDATGNVYRSPDRSDRRYGPGGAIDTADGFHFSYDADGNLASRTAPDGAVHRYHWNGAGLLHEVELPDDRRVRFEYDAFARRTRKLVVRQAEEGGELLERDTRFVWDGHVVVHEVDRDEGVTTWFWEPGTFTPVARERNGERWAVVSDHLGTPTEMYDPAGELAWKMQLDLFGVPTLEAGGVGDCPWRWPGQYEDSETGLCYNWRRYYDQQAGTYCSPDPLGIRPGLSRYAYAPDPTQGIDPLGLFFGSTSQVGYWDHGFQDELNQAYKSGQAHPGGNVAVVELANGETKWFASGANGHSEAQMIQWMKENNIPPSEIKTIYSELSPCLGTEKRPGCLPKLAEFLGEDAKNVELQYTWIHGLDGKEGQAQFMERTEKQRTRCGG